MTERRSAQDPAEGADDPAVYGGTAPNATGSADAGDMSAHGEANASSLESPPHDTDSADIDPAVEDVAEAMPGAGRLNEDPNAPGSSDPDLRTNGPAPLP